MTENDDTRGFLISFEGSEGSGKSTQISRIADRFEDAGYEVIVTREPGGTPIGEEIRHTLMHAAEGHNMMPETELLLFAASRAQLVREVILPAVEAGKIVLCDRFMDSTTVYQGVARNIQSEPVHMINTFAVGETKPDVTVVIDLDAEVGLQRVKHRANDLPDRMEKENIEFYQKVRNGYLMLAKAMPERFIVVDGELHRDELENAIWKQLRQRVI
ncbi:dTMP kinase [Puniceicoccales bacterium CK1056]|uniref:Thymidylate kinase n=1 Tax=Oceanipulchritudo coccoides TaxID=2706888 RepID=A0A6B2M339_9BACT|nr:dTMP kinase [Oceanipulchritudo coccoides]NDV62826.1 dTMP kinase [Oceanipulchritudo coccoides]